MNRAGGLGVGFKVADPEHAVIYDSGMMTKLDADFSADVYRLRRGASRGL